MPRPLPVTFFGIQYSHQSWNSTLYNFRSLNSSLNSHNLTTSDDSQYQFTLKPNTRVHTRTHAHTHIHTAPLTPWELRCTRQSDYATNANSVPCYTQYIRYTNHVITYRLAILYRNGVPCHMTSHHFGRLHTVGNIAALLQAVHR
jgi:hypothetical protein